MDCLIFWGSFVLTVVLRTKNRGLDQLFGAFFFCALLGAKKVVWITIAVTAIRQDSTDLTSTPHFDRNVVLPIHVLDFCAQLQRQQTLTWLTGCTFVMFQDS